MSTITLDSIREAADKQYGSTDIDLGNDVVVRLLNPLRLSKEKRDSLVALTGTLGEEGVDEGAVLRDVIMAVAATEEQGATLLAEIADDLAVMVGIFESYMEGTELGEASASQD